MVPVMSDIEAFDRQPLIERRGGFENLAEGTPTRCVLPNNFSGLPIDAASPQRSVSRLQNETPSGRQGKKPLLAF